MFGMTGRARPFPVTCRHMLRFLRFSRKKSRKRMLIERGSADCAASTYYLAIS
ncbi:hypothetical protein HMPREF0080_01143 [Anaeroglobus geminatus F0357]|uniref:Uncharacterized protein n=1 Tax=Anaeroglobus geminatus F0357 TaxID=861450 RepID=G9YHK9_9FIRM|nr:hypothetical protein HMPREF0080_01143 [Anaeroglobus geminatus F0357]